MQVIKEKQICSRAGVFKHNCSPEFETYEKQVCSLSTVCVFLFIFWGVALAKYYLRQCSKLLLVSSVWLEICHFSVLYTETDSPDFPKIFPEMCPAYWFCKKTVTLISFDLLRYFEVPWGNGPGIVRSNVGMSFETVDHFSIALIFMFFRIVLLYNIEE